MSALFGVVAAWPTERLGERLRCMDARLASYGPDGAATAVAVGCGVGRRLRRTLPEDAFDRHPRQQNGILFAAIGRVDNRPELLAELGLPALELADADLLYEAYRVWGSEVARKAIGAYTFLAWHETERRLFAVRSALSGPAIYYCRHGDGWFFSTRPRGLFTIPGVRREPNLEYVTRFLMWVPQDLQQSFYKDVAVLPAGCSMTLQRDTVTLHRDWSIADTPDLRFSNRADCYTEFVALFDRVVRDHMRSVGEIGVMMSGGLDSSALGASAAILSQTAGRSLRTYTEVPGAVPPQLLPWGRYADERPFVEAIAAMHPAMHPVFAEDSVAFPFDTLEPAFDAAECPFRNISNRPWWEEIQQRASSDGVRVLLTGVGGNLNVSWDGSTLIADLLRAGRLREAWSEAGKTAEAGYARSRFMALVGANGLMQLLPDALWLPAERLRRGEAHRSWRDHTPLHPDFVAAQRIEQPWQAAGGALQFRRPSTLRQLVQRILEQSTVGDDIDRGYLQAYGVETRHPLLDPRIAAFCCGLPSHFFRHEGEPRALIREGMKDRLPAIVRSNRIRGLQASNWYAALFAHRKRIRERLDSIAANSLASRILDLPRLRSLEAAMPVPEAVSPARSLVDYRSYLCAGLLMGSFLIWMEQTAKEEVAQSLESHVS